jgi:exodeoxyribonuclease VII large subunit
VRNDASFLTVSQVNALLKAKIEEDDDLHGLVVKGEISNWKPYRSGVFFDLKDQASVISCLLWSDSALYLSFEPKEGDEVLATGSLSVYAPRGRYSLTVSTLELYGQGKALLALEALKKKLQAEGLFDPSRKRPIPRFPRTLGIIVGKGSAAEADLLKNLQRRWPLADIFDFPALVQGKEAPASLLKALETAETYPLDTLILARGGGSEEDLSAFNDERLARALANSPIPTVSAVGHEIDTTLIDYVSDLRVSTPTGAAEAATPDQNDIRNGLADSEDRLNASIDKTLTNCREKIVSLSSRPFFRNPAAQYVAAGEKVRTLSQRLAAAMDHQIALRKENIVSYAGRLKALNPEGVLSRGYSITQNANGKIIASIKDLQVGEEVKTKLKDGIMHSKVVRKE